MGIGLLSIVNGRSNPQSQLTWAKRDEEWYGTVCMCPMDGAMPCGVVCRQTEPPWPSSLLDLGRGRASGTAATLLCPYSPFDLARRMERDGIVSAPFNGLGPFVDARLSGRCVERRGELWVVPALEDRSTTKAQGTRPECSVAVRCGLLARN
jgi:hypothetical protein